MEATYIKTMDFTFENVSILNASNESELANLIKEGKVIKINNFGAIEYINSNYIMFYQLRR